jgi:large subunit ribosomal protein L6
LPILIPAGVDVKCDGSVVTIKGPKGMLTRTIADGLKIEKENGQIKISPESGVQKIKALWGLNRVLVQNMITGVNEGYQKTLEIVGVGYKADVKGKVLNLAVGYSHPVNFTAPDGINFAIDGPTKIIISGIDKQMVGQIASEIRKKRPPEPYKAKGVKYIDEIIRRKAGKTAAK